MTKTMEVRAVLTEDEAVWRSMWADYIAFYKALVPAEVTSTTWHRILDPDFPMGAVVALTNGEIAGFANFVSWPYTWSERPHCLMEDLFVRPEFRGRGAGQALIRHLIGLCRQNGWGKLYWITQESNAIARRLYDSFTPADGFVQYTVGIDDDTDPSQSSLDRSELPTT